ncbi:MAG: hypothetical protein WBP73_03030, partial [Terriglobales bacterium]
RSPSVVICRLRFPASHPAATGSNVPPGQAQPNPAQEVPPMFNTKTRNNKTLSLKTFNHRTPRRMSFSRSVIAKLSLGACIAAVCVLPACSISTNDKGKDGDKNVDIKSPLGDLHVSEQADIRDSGLTLYPGARPAPKDNSDDKKSANVNLSIAGFSLKVVAAEFVSDDAPDKIIAYYTKELQKYGKPIQCHGEWAGKHVESKAGKEEGSKPVSCDSDNGGDSVELKVGTEENQHIVSVKPSGHGSHFALVYVRVHTGKEDTI